MLQDTKWDNLTNLILNFKLYYKSNNLQLL